MVSRERRARVAAFVAPALLTGCWGLDPLDLVGTGEIVHEQRQFDPLRDDVLADKRPEHDPDRTVTETFDGCSVVLNKSASVTRLTLQSAHARDDQLRGTIFPSRAAAVAALDGETVLPSIEIVNGALKPFNDGLYAAVELAAEEGDGSPVNKRELLRGLLAELARRSSEGAEAERPHARDAAAHLATALVLSGEDEAIPAELGDAATSRAADFRADPLFAKPIGFYTWTPELEAVFTRDRWLQSRYVPGAVGPVYAPTFGALSAISLATQEAESIADDYRRTLGLYAGLTDPFFDASPFELAGFVSSAAAFDDLKAVEGAFAASRPPEYPGVPFCNPGVAALPASESVDNRMMRKLLCGGEIPPGENLLDALIARIQSGELDLAPRADSGWYDHQIYALETLLVTDKGPESQHLLLTRAYKEKLVETFKSLLIQTRETHVKQVAVVDARVAGDVSRPQPFFIHPKLAVEPFPTFYLRTARAYRFVEGVLESVLGPAFLDGTARLIEDGSRGDLTLREELHDKARLLYGLHAVAADSIGMAPELVEDELSGFPLAEARDFARAWLDGALDDPDVARDPRVSLPVALETDPRSGIDYAVYWAVVGVKALHVHASFPETHRPEVVSVAPFCVHEGWKPFEPYVLVEQTLEVRRPATAAPLDREEFRALCDLYDNVDDIRAAFESAP